MRGESLCDSEVTALARRVEMIAGDDFRTSFPATTPSRVRLTQDGKESQATVTYPLGDVANPMAWDQVEEKLRDLAREMPALRSDEIIAACELLAGGNVDASRLRRALTA